ncbi:hypothetical protein TGME49_289270 [Toxoplasma gondii ME49]|uniref:Uncharacterized protein n=3 Tax=Toxoplasma gondii TaxID=5811 RepID=S8G874_TOXGM|nr:hypothetical protein TGME49_289270 [Toxoplasma gondii ME49]EPT27930.1 hypothetical protein TGME49_289270 [Toxoplasma gondii ME49]|eukprot:XP_018636399.1 hypothetical protein TGME49_289270 [Toxoplasma gondii ME49]
MIAPVRTLKHPYEGCKCHAVFTSASSSPPVLPLTPLPIEQHAQPSTCRENAENTETAFTAFRTFLEYPEVEPGQWRDFQERYFRYLQWEAAKAKHYIPYLVSPEVADFFLSEEKLSAGRPEKTRNCRKRKQQKRKVPPLQSSLPSTVLNLPSDLSVQALEFQALLLRQQITPSSFVGTTDLK